MSNDMDITPTIQELDERIKFIEALHAPSNPHLISLELASQDFKEFIPGLRQDKSDYLDMFQNILKVTASLDFQLRELKGQVIYLQAKLNEKTRQKTKAAF